MGATRSIVAKIGCINKMQRHGARQFERDSGDQAGLTTDEQALLKQLQLENRELKRASEILRKALAFFA